MTSWVNDEYFEAMKVRGTAFEAKRARRKLEKEALIKAGDWEGVKAWNEREKQFPFPFSEGYMKAYRAWWLSKENQSSTFEVQELPWAKEVHDFITCLKEAGVTEFAITDRSTALMEILHVLFDEEGCRMLGLCKVTRSEKHWGNEGTETYEGILMRIP